MKELKQGLDEAKAAGIKKVFIAFHNPTFCRSGMGAIPEAQNPHKTIASYAKDLDIVVFNGHVHTTEQYEVDGVKYLLMGGGGAEQDPILPGRTTSRFPPAIRRTSIGRAQPPRRNTTTCLWTCSPDRRRSLHSTASGRGRLNLSRPWSCLNEGGYRHAFPHCDFLCPPSCCTRSRRWSSLPCMFTWPSVISRSCLAGTSNGLTSGKVSAHWAAHTSSRHWLRARLADAKIGWIAIGMKNGWKQIFSSEEVKCRIRRAR